MPTTRTAEKVLMFVQRLIDRLVHSAIATVTLFVLSYSAAFAQAPGRPITIIVPYSPGTGIDILARAIGNELSQKWGQPVVIDNKTGASGNIGTGQIGRAHV